MARSFPWCGSLARTMSGYRRCCRGRRMGCNGTIRRDGDRECGLGSQGGSIEADRDSNANARQERGRLVKGTSTQPTHAEAPCVGPRSHRRGESKIRSSYHLFRKTDQKPLTILYDFSQTFAASTGKVKVRRDLRLSKKRVLTAAGRTTLPESLEPGPSCVQRSRARSRATGRLPRSCIPSSSSPRALATTDPAGAGYPEPFETRPIGPRFQKAPAIVDQSGRNRPLPASRERDHPPIRLLACWRRLSSIMTCFRIRGKRRWSRAGVRRGARSVRKRWESCTRACCTASSSENSAGLSRKQAIQYRARVRWAESNSGAVRSRMRRGSEGLESRMSSPPGNAKSLIILAG